MATVTERGKFLKALVDPDTGQVSVRELAKRLSKRNDMPDAAETIRRTLHRHISPNQQEGLRERDVSDEYVAAISDVLGIDPDEWPAPTPRQTQAALRQRVVELERELERVRHGDPSAQERDGER